MGSGDFGKGYVHVMTEESFQDIMNELDTVTDMTAPWGGRHSPWAASPKPHRRV
jgi:hypothetical protein